MARYGLCIGVNDYPGTSSDLAGCVPDAEAFTAELRGRGFEVRQLLDAAATKTRIVDGLRDLVARTGYGDLGIVTYSGHGTWTADLDGDEADGRDEALCPQDVFTAGPLTDDTLHTIFAERRYGARLVMISDSCHSGTVTRLAGPLGDSPDRVRFLPPQVYDTDARAVAGTARSLPRPSVLLLSGCADWEYSYDAWFDGQPNGAFTKVALDTLRSLPAGATMRDWHTAIRTKLPSRDYPQTPALYGPSDWKRWPAP
jgi:hypothetical protein